MSSGRFTVGERRGLILLISILGVLTLVMILTGGGDSDGRTVGDESARESDLVTISQPFTASDSNSLSGDSIDSHNGANARRQSRRRKSAAKSGKTVAAPPPERSPLDDELN